MGRRDVASFAVIVMFGVSLAATSRPKPDRDEAEDGGGRAHVVAEADAGAVDAAKTAVLAADAAGASAEVPAATTNAELADTAAWKPVAFPALKLAAKAPPNAEVTCARTGELTTCSVVRHGKSLALFLSLKLELDGMIYAMKRERAVPSSTIFEDANAVAVMRSDPTQGSWCDFASSSPSGLHAIVQAQHGDAGIEAVTLNRTECLEMIAFGRTLVRTP